MSSSILARYWSTPLQRSTIVQVRVAKSIVCAQEGVESN